MKKAITSFLLIIFMILSYAIAIPPEVFMSEEMPGVPVFVTLKQIGMLICLTSVMFLIVFHLIKRNNKDNHELVMKIDKMITLTKILLIISMVLIFTLLAMEWTFHAIEV